MNAWSRQGRSGYAEWFPEVDLHVGSRWPREEPQPEPTPLVSRVPAEAEAELGETA